MTYHIPQQIGDHLAEPVAVPDDDGGGRLAVGGQGDEGAGAIGGQDRHIRQRPGAHGGQVDSLHGHLAPLVDAGQLEQVLDETAHAGGLVLDAPHDLVLTLRRHPAHAVQLAVAADRRQRGAQLVRGVGHEAGHALLGDDLDGEGLLVLLEHHVQRPLERTDLRARGLGHGHAGGQVAAGDPPGHPLDLAQGAEGAVHQVGGRHGPHEDDGDVRQRHDEAGALDRLPDVAQRQGDGDHAQVVAGAVDEGQADDPPLEAGLGGAHGAQLLVCGELGLGLLQGGHVDDGDAVLGRGVVGDHVARLAVEVLGLDVVGRRHEGVVARADLLQRPRPDRLGGHAQLVVDLAEQVGVQQRGDRQGHDQQPHRQQARGDERQAAAQGQGVPGAPGRGQGVPAALLDRTVLALGRQAVAPPGGLPVGRRAAPAGLRVRDAGGRARRRGRPRPPHAAGAHVSRPWARGACSQRPGASG